MVDRLACPPRIGLIYLDLMAPTMPKSWRNGLGLDNCLAVEHTRLSGKQRR